MPPEEDEEFVKYLKNTNMDLILTLMKQTCFYNNSIRLVIVSATMDDDEPIYRSYFRNINDNLVYPIISVLHVIEKCFRIGVKAPKPLLF